jgi:hypothetical protein
MNIGLILTLLLCCLVCPPALAQTTTDDAVNARLLVAARTNDEPGLVRALADGAAINSRNRLGESALIIALPTSTSPRSTASRR